MKEVDHWKWLVVIPKVRNYCIWFDQSKCLNRGVKGKRHALKKVVFLNFQMTSTKFKVINTKYEVRSAKCEVRSAKCEVRITKCEVRITKYQITSIKFQSFVQSHWNLGFGICLVAPLGPPSPRTPLRAPQCKSDQNPCAVSDSFLIFRVSQPCDQILKSAQHAKNHPLPGAYRHDVLL
jgi:hypothetical protein